MDSQTGVKQPILDGGIRSINFFNGRLLTGSDMRREQAAVREIDRRLGVAVGEGVAYGLEVSVSPQSTAQTPAVTVEAGLAVNRAGQTLALRDKLDVRLAPGASGPTNGSAASGFAVCSPAEEGIYVAGEGVYLLALSPALGTEGSAPVSGLDNTLASCNTDTIVEAAQLRLVPLVPPLTQAELQAESAHLRNYVAYRCFGAGWSEAFASEPFAAQDAKRGLVEELRGKSLTDCDVPLAVLHLTISQGVKFVDNWAVRRRLTRRDAAGRWSPFADERRAAEGEAMFLQFQEHIDALRTGAAPQLVSAKSVFRRLPPVGVIPLSGFQNSKGFDYVKFFEGLTYHKPVFVGAARVEALVRSAYPYAPADLASGEMFWLYHVKENIEPIDTGQPEVARPYMIFTTGHVPYQGDARYDLAYWEYGNYALAEPQ